MTEKLPGPIYRTWDEAMADPDLDLSKPWFVAPEPRPANVYWAPPGTDPQAWPDGWTEIGYTTDDAGS